MSVEDKIEGMKILAKRVRGYYSHISGNTLGALVEYTVGIMLEEEISRLERSEELESVICGS